MSARKGIVAGVGRSRRCHEPEVESGVQVDGPGSKTEQVGIVDCEARSSDCRSSSGPRRRAPLASRGSIKRKTRRVFPRYAKTVGDEGDRLEGAGNGDTNFCESEKRASQCPFAKS